MNRVFVKEGRFDTGGRRRHTVGEHGSTQHGSTQHGSTQHGSTGGDIMIDWNGCDDVERIPGKVSGAWLVKGTRIRVDDVLANAAGLAPEQVVAEVYPSLPLDRARRVIAFAASGPAQRPAARQSD